MSESKQAVLPLWGNAENANAVRVAAVHRFTELCDMFVEADEQHNEAQMGWCFTEMRAVLAHIGTFQRAQFRKWAKKRGYYVREESQRR